jgi:hypothetical protein
VTAGADTVPAVPSGRRLGRLRVDSRLALGVLVLLVAVLRYVPLRNNGWFLDDNLYLIIGHSDGLTLSWLFSNLFEHFGILYRFSFTVIYHLMPFSWRWAFLVSLVMLAGAVVLLDRCLRLLLDSRWAPLLLAGSFGLSVLFIEALEWESSALQNLPTALGDLLCLYGYLRYLAAPSRRWILISAAGLVFALLFYEKGSFMLGYLLAIRVAFLTPQLSWRELRRIAVSERPFWLTIIGVLILWLIGLKLVGAGGMFINPSPSQWVEYWRIMWGQTLVPGVLGLHIPFFGVTPGQVIEGVALQAVIVIAIVASIWRKRAAWRAWCLLIIFVVVNGVLVAEERVVVLKAAASIGGDTRYLLDFTWLVPLLLAFAFSRARTFWPDPARLRMPLTLPAPGRPRALGALALLATVAYVVAAQMNTDAIQSAWLGPAALQWEQNLQNGVARDTHAGVGPVIADSQTPYQVLASIYPPYDHISYLAPFYIPSAQVDGPLRGPLVVADALGNLHPAQVHVLESFPGRPGGCLTNRGPDPMLMLHDIKVHVPASAGPFYLIVRYGPTDAPYLAYTGTLKDPPAGQDEFISIAPRVGASIGYMGQTLPSQLFTELPGHSRMCLHLMRIITLSLT